MNLITAVKVGVTVVNNRKKIGKYIAGFIIGFILLLSIPLILINSIGNFISKSISEIGDNIANTFSIDNNNSADIINTDSYEILSQAYEEFKSDFISKMQARANEIREENKEWIDTDGDGEGYYEYPVSASASYQDIPISKIYAYFSLKNSTITEKKESYIATSDEIKKFLEDVFSMEEEWIDSNTATVFNKIMSDEEILEHYYPDDADKKEFYTSSKEIFEEIIGKSSVAPPTTQTFSIEDIIKTPKMYFENMLNPSSTIVGMPAKNYEAPINGSNNKVVYYSQSGGQAWSGQAFGGGTIGSSGCSVTCLAMVLSYESNSTILPSDVVNKIAERTGSYNKFYVGDAGQSWSIFPNVAKYYGFKCHELSQASVKSMLSSGHPVIASCKAGEFTSNGHFIVLTGITSDGKVTVNDPNYNHREKSSKHYDFDSIKGQFKGYWSMTR